MYSDGVNYTIWTCSSGHKKYASDGTYYGGTQCQYSYYDETLKNDYYIVNCGKTENTIESAIINFN